MKKKQKFISLLHSVCPAEQQCICLIDRLIAMHFLCKLLRMHLVKTRRQGGLAIGKIFSQTFCSKDTKMKPPHTRSVRHSDGLISFQLLVLLQHSFTQIKSILVFSISQAKFKYIIWYRLNLLQMKIKRYHLSGCTLHCTLHNHCISADKRDEVQCVNINRKLLKVVKI